MKHFDSFHCRNDKTNVSKVGINTWCLRKIVDPLSPTPEQAHRRGNTCLKLSVCWSVRLSQYKEIYPKGLTWDKIKSSVSERSCSICFSKFCAILYCLKEMCHKWVPNHKNSTTITKQKLSCLGNDQVWWLSSCCRSWKLELNKLICALYWYQLNNLRLN